MRERIYLAPVEFGAERLALGAQCFEAVGRCSVDLGEAQIKLVKRPIGSLAQ